MSNVLTYKRRPLDLFSESIIEIVPILAEAADRAGDAVGSDEEARLIVRDIRRQLAEALRIVNEAEGELGDNRSATPDLLL
ncbi:hypothetical protein [Methylosinus sp. KRF6]|uniref:hypothetical protein n=1 Tax=Methylosinus sp. KRF6 TaxID=2846853 RepID=UPI001C0D42F7|nr:hypothetical protein [Methylosinus sp. KRF6]MBU3887590.1 hypothetical protein [Methylosinus sp. KRF6]